MTSTKNSDGSSANLTIKITKNIKHCPLCDFSLNSHMLRHVERHHNLVNKDSAKALTTVQSTLSSQGVKLIRMMDIKKIFGQLWEAIDARRIAHKMCILGQLQPWNGKWDIPGVEDPTDLVTLHLIPGSSVDTIWNIPGLVAPLVHVSSHTTLVSSVNVDEFEPFIPNILVDTAFEAERVSSVETQRLDPQLPLVDDQSISTKQSLNSGRSQTLRSLKTSGLREKLPDDYILINLFRDAIKNKHSPTEVQNQLGAIRRVFFYVHSNMKKAGTPPKHWSDMLVQYQLVIDYFDVRLSLNATKWTMKTYKKHITSLYNCAITIFPFCDESFPGDDYMVGKPSSSLVRQLEDSIAYIKRNIWITEKTEEHVELVNVNRVQEQRSETTQNVTDEPIDPNLAEHLEPRVVLSKSLRSVLKIMGCHDQLPKNHIMLTMYSDLLKRSHPTQPKVVLNYVANISRVFMYVFKAMKKAKIQHQHWSDMLQQPQLIIEYLDTLTKYTVASTTIISYLKQLRGFYMQTVKILCFSDSSFPKDDASLPCSIVLRRINYSMDVLTNYYTGIGKLSIQTQFNQRLLDSERVLDLKTLVRD